jgi:hypothetical protein
MTAEPDLSRYSFSVGGQRSVAAVDYPVATWNSPVIAMT